MRRVWGQVAVLEWLDIRGSEVAGAQRFALVFAALLIGIAAVIVGTRADLVVAHDGKIGRAESSAATAVAA